MAQLCLKSKKPGPSVIKAMPLRYEVYVCPELGRTSNRPNAYDAFDLPSVYGGLRKPYRFGMLS